MIESLYIKSALLQRFLYSHIREPKWFFIPFRPVYPGFWPLVVIFHRSPMSASRKALFGAWVAGPAWGGFILISLCVYVYVPV